MTGQVFHPGHSELHGITVVLETGGSKIYIGRYDSEDAAGVHLLDVGVYDAATHDLSKDDFVRRSARFGVRSDHKHLVVPAEQVTRITPLGKLSS